MLVKFPGFVGSAFGPQSKNIDAQDLMNWYLEVTESPFGKVPTGLMPCPGFEPFCLLPKSPVRGLFAQNDRLFGVGGDSLYEISRDGVATQIHMTQLAAPVAPTITNSPLAAALDKPTLINVTQGGALGTTAYTYQVTAINERGETLPSDALATANGNATLSAVNYNLITWQRVDGATGYRIYRFTATVSNILVGSVPATGLLFLDIGTAGTAQAPPVTNTTGDVIGSTTYGYKIVATLGLGQTAASGEGVTLTGQAELTEDDYNIVTWPAVPNAHMYFVYRTTGGPNAPVLIGTTAEVTFNDTSLEGDPEVPSVADTTGTATLVDDGAVVSMCSSGDAGLQLFIVSGGSGFVYDMSENTLAKVVTGATVGGYIGTYFIALDAATSTLKSSERLDGFTWDDSQIYQRTAAGDRWLSMAVTATEINLMGGDSGEVWKLTGDDDTRFAPFNDITIDQGIIASASLNVAKSGTLMWLGQNRNGAGSVYQTSPNGAYVNASISTRGIEKDIKTFSTIADAVAWSYDDEGHSFYVLTFPSDDATWVFDSLTGEWHRRGYWDPNNMAFTSYRAQCHAFAFGGVGFGLHVVGDRLSGQVAVMSTDYGYDFDGAVIRRLRDSPYVSKNGVWITINELVIDLEVGLGVPLPPPSQPNTHAGAGQDSGVDPQLMLQISKDGGKTWGRPIWRSAGKQGAYQQRLRFNMLGDARFWVIRIVATAPIPWRIAGAYYDITVGIS